MDYVKLFLCVAVLCVICPPFLGYVTGIVAFCTLWFVFYKMIGGT